MAGLTSGFQARRNIIQKGGKLLTLEVVNPDIAGRDGIDPSVKIHMAFTQLKGNRGMSERTFSCVVLIRRSLPSRST